jgi:BRCT domain type II-containing protein
MNKTMIFTDATGKQTLLVAGDKVRLKDGRTVVISQTTTENFVVLGGDAVVRDIENIAQNHIITINDIAEIVQLCFNLFRALKNLFLGWKN